MEFFPSFPDSARIWIVPATAEISADAEPRLVELLQTFAAGWKAHGAPVRGSAMVAFKRFVILAADTTATEVSGCSIDSAFRAAREALQQHGLAVADRGAVFSLEANVVHERDRDQFADAVKGGTVTPETLVFNNALQTLGELRSGAWQPPFSAAPIYKRYC